MGAQRSGVGEWADSLKRAGNSRQGGMQGWMQRRQAGLRCRGCTHVAGHNQSNVDKEKEMCRHGPSSAVQQQQTVQAWVCRHVAGLRSDSMGVFLSSLPRGAGSVRGMLYNHGAGVQACSGC